MTMIELAIVFLVLLLVLPAGMKRITEGPLSYKDSSRLPISKRVKE